MGGGMTRGCLVHAKRKGIQTPMAQGRSSEIISMIRWIRTSRMSIKNSLSLGFRDLVFGFRVHLLGSREHNVGGHEFLV